MIRRLPLVPTVLVLLAVGIMIRLGFWQLDRLHQKEALLARYAIAGSDPAAVPFPQNERETALVLYRHAQVYCRKVVEATGKAGSSARGQSGWAHYVTCQLADGTRADIVLGWSREPNSPEWSGGEVTGIIAPGPRLVADPPLAGLKANALPDPADIPNNHLAYAVQWFLFALTALVIYALAVRKRLRGG